MKIVILAGGQGTRLWPLSRPYFPKQYLKLPGLKWSLFQVTLQRALRLVAREDLLIVTQREQIFLVCGALEELGIDPQRVNLIEEPCGRNTFPAVCLALKSICSKQADETVLIWPCDHWIEEENELMDIFRESLSSTQRYLVTFGVMPSHPHTGFGYIQPGSIAGNGFQVDQFHEKPNSKLAQEYIYRGYLWNSGIVMASCGLIIEEICRYAPHLWAQISEEMTEEGYASLPSLSMDKGLLEKSTRVLVVPISVGWNDLGSFESWHAFSERGLFNNCGETKKNLVFSSSGKSVVFKDVDNLIVVDEPDVLLICQKDNSHDLKEIALSHEDSLNHRPRDYRPWGHYDVLDSRIDDDGAYKIKRITILPGKRISLQSHRNRSEHWVVLKGTAWVEIEGNSQWVEAGESIYVSRGERHRIENKKKNLLEILEIQKGSQVDEEDIVRYQDDYGRSCHQNKTKDAMS